MCACMCQTFIWVYMCVCVCVCVCVCMREREGVSDRLLREWRCFWQRLLVVQYSANAFFYLDSRGCVACNPQSWKRNAKHSHPTPQQINIFWVYSTMTCYKQVQIFKLDSKFHRRWSPVKGAHRIKYDNFSHSCSTPQPPMQPNPLLSSNLCSNKPQTLGHEKPTRTLGGGVGGRGDKNMEKKNYMEKNHKVTNVLRCGSL